MKQETWKNYRMQKVTISDSGVARKVFPLLKNFSFAVAAVLLDGCKNHTGYATD